VTLSRNSRLVALDLGLEGQYGDTHVLRSLRIIKNLLGLLLSLFIVQCPEVGDGQFEASTMQGRLIAQYRLKGFDGGEHITLLTLENAFLE